MNARAARASGFDLLRQYMDRKPDMLTRRISRAMNAGGIVWREPPGTSPPKAAVHRWTNLDFLCRGKAPAAWKDYWPQDGCGFSWDAVGRVQIGKVGWEWLPVTAHVHPRELMRAHRGSIDTTNRRVISAVRGAQQSFKVGADADWLRGNMDLATRLSALSFLREYSVCVRMLFVHFYDDRKSKNTLLPSQADWRPAIAKADQQLGLTGKSVLERRICRMFLPAICD